MASGRSLELAKIQPRGPVRVSNDDLPAGQSQPDGSPTRVDLRRAGRRSDRWTAARPRRVEQAPRPSPYALERHMRRMERRARSIGLVMLRPPGWGAKHERALRARDAAAIPVDRTYDSGMPEPKKKRRIRVPWKPASRERIYQRQTGGRELTPRQLRSLRRAENRTLARARKGTR